MINITNKAIVDYLLGRTNENQASDFLALCFSSDENTEKFEIVRDNLIENYLNGNLHSLDKLQFEKYFLADFNNKELFELSKTIWTNLGENKNLEVLALAKTENKSFSVSRFLVPIGSLAVLLIGGILFWQMFLKPNNSQIAEGKPAQLETPQVKPSVLPEITPVLKASITPSPTPVKTNLNFNSSNSPKVSSTPKEPIITNQNIQIMPTPQINKPPKIQENPILTFILPMIAKSPGNKNTLKISNRIKEVNLLTAKPKDGFTSYTFFIFKGSKVLYTEELEKFSTNEKGQIVISVPAKKFEKGTLRFIFKGKNTEGTDEELKGLRAYI